MWWIAISIILTITIYWLLHRPYQYWRNKGVKQGSYVLLFGDNWKPFTRQEHFAEMVQTVYNKCPNTRYSGFYQMLTPTLLLKDPNLIKQITVKDFDHFVDHRVLISETNEPLWGKNLFSLTGKKWRDMRTTLSPSFTSSKIKNIFSLILQSGEQFTKHFLEKNEDVVVVELKDVMTRFANDIVGNVAFGIECDSLGDRNNDFYKMGKEITNLSGFWQTLKFIMFFLSPNMAKWLGFSIFPKNASTFFIELIKKNIESREKHGIVRQDMINLLLEARKHGLKYEENHSVQEAGFAAVQESEIGKNQKTIKKEITDEDITAQALIFFFAGFDSVSTLMCFMSYELGVNPDIQQKLIQEVDETREACDGKLTYETLLGMKYMDMVISETLRKWPNAAALDRVCTKPYTIEPKTPEEKPVHLKEKDVVWIPVFALHRDPDYFPDPDRFDPERFSDENKSKIKPYTYLPFGSGPRNCIGSRFALLETKTLFFHLLSNFEIAPVEKTQVPLKLDKKSFNMTAEGGFWFGFKRRTRIE